MNLDDRLREAFRRDDPPEGFAERLRERIAREPIAPAREIKRRVEAPPRQSWFRWVWLPASACAVLTAVLFSVAISNRHVEEERAGRQAIQALQIASQKLNLAVEALNK